MDGILIRSFQESRTLLQEGRHYLSISHAVSFALRIKTQTTKNGKKTYRDELISAYSNVPRSFRKVDE